MPARRCSGLSTKNSPPSDQNAWAPRLLRFSWSRTSTRRPAFASSWAATSPARPAPTTMTSGSSTRVRLRVGVDDREEELAPALADDRVVRLDEDLPRGALVDRDQRGQESLPVEHAPADLAERSLQEREEQLRDARLAVGEDAAQPGRAKRVGGELGLHAVPGLVDDRDVEHPVDALRERRHRLALGGLDRLGGGAQQHLGALLPHREEHLVEGDEVGVEGAAGVAGAGADALDARPTEPLVGEDLHRGVEQALTGLGAPLGDAPWLGSLGHDTRMYQIHTCIERLNGRLADVDQRLLVRLHGPAGAQQRAADRRAGDSEQGADQ